MKLGAVLGLVRVVEVAFQFMAVHCWIAGLLDCWKLLDTAVKEQTINNVSSRPCYDVSILRRLTTR